jgi:hypothetical protein
METQMLAGAVLPLLPMMKTVAAITIAIAIIPVTPDQLPFCRDFMYSNPHNPHNLNPNF